MKQEPSVRRCPDRRTATVERVWRRLQTVMDPELPQLSVTDLGMIRSVEATENGSIRIGVSPTYCGCPALRVIHEDVRAALCAIGMARVEVHDVPVPAWTSDWITERGRAVLRQSGIAPPDRIVPSGHAPSPAAGGERGSASEQAPRVAEGGPRVIACPRCDSARTERVSEFGSTPCKAQYRCLDCLEPFEHFKCI